MARRLEVEIIGDSRSLERALGRSQKATGSFGRSLKNAAKTAAFGIAGLTVAGTVLGKKMIDLASDAAEVESKFRVVFGKQMPRMVDELDSFSKATGASRFELREQAADMGALLKPLSESTKAAGDMSIQFVKLATDLSSFNNVPVEDALLAIRSGLVGESEPLRRFGVLLNESAVKAEGLRMGLIKGKEEMTEQQKVLARSNLIMQQTTLAQGDAERTAGSFANQMRALTNGLRDTGTEIGLVLLPHVLKLVSFLNDNMPTIKNVMKSALEGITFAIEHGIVPAVQKAALVFREIAEAAREHWPKVRTAAESVANWYRANLQPTFESVSRNLVRIWDRMGSDLQNTTKGHLTRLPPLVQAQLGNIASVATAGLAILRGDWSTAWNELKEIPIRTFRSLVQTIKSLVGTVYQAAMAVGAAVVDGIKAGISSAWGSLTSWVGEKMADLKDAITHPWRIGSPSKVTIEIGQRIAEGLGVGFGLGMVTVTQEAADKINQAIDNMVRAVQDRRGALGEAMSELVSQALGAFDELTSQFETKAERQIRVTEERRAKADRIRRRDEAQAALNTAIAAGDPEAEAEARRELEDAKWEITRAGLEREAEAQRRAFEERRELRRRHFEEELATLQ
jgi:hypothetical protein